LSLIDFVLADFKENRSLKNVLPVLKKNKHLVDELVQLVELEAPYPKSEYASWILTHLAKEDRSFLDVYKEKIIDCILNSKNQSVLRNLVGTLNSLSYCSYKESELIDTLFNFLLDKSNKVALHVYSIYLLQRYLIVYTELKNELDAILSTFDQNCSPAMKVAIRKYFHKK
jgi:hypothetical protein